MHKKGPVIRLPFFLPTLPHFQTVNRSIFKLSKHDLTTSQRGQVSGAMTVTQSNEKNTEEYEKDPLLAAPSSARHDTSLSTSD